MRVSIDNKVLFRLISCYRKSIYDWTQYAVHVWDAYAAINDDKNTSGQA